jgi:uncharacterized membrane protein YeaQ/YmgE (transglycosylase-associated protein family)
MIAGVCTALAVHVVTGGRGWGILSPAIAGLAAAVVAWVISFAVAEPNKTDGGALLGAPGTRRA